MSTRNNNNQEEHSLSGDGRGKDLSRKDTDRGRCTHFLKMAEGETCQDTEKPDQARRTHFLEKAERGTCQGTQTKDRAKCTH